MRTSENKRILSQNIKFYMDLKGVTNQQLCADLGFKYTTFIDWINEVTYPRIWRIEAMANYFGCEKSDLIEDRREKVAEDDGLSESQRLLIQFAHLVPEEKADLALRVMKSILEDGK
jgi:repressor LexA